MKQGGYGARSWIALFLLCGVYILNFLDRSLLSILAKPIEDALHISDGQIGLVSGLYFALFYCFIAIPVGWFADRTNRVNVLCLACSLWSAATAGCGLAANFGQLAVARMAVGVGEAGGVPPSYALITDFFPTRQRGMALGIYNLGPALGAAAGIAFGASIAAAFNWRDAFYAIGILGVIAAVIFRLSVREPPRGGLDENPVHGRSGATTFWSTVRMFFSRPALVLVALGSGATQFITYGAGNFTTLFLMREKGMTLKLIAVYYALVILIGMGSGMIISGRVIDRFAPGNKAAYATIPAISLILATPFYLGFVWAPSWQLALWLLLPPMCLNYFYLSAAVALVQEEVRPDQRVVSGALLLLIMNFIGLGLGPTYVGAASDFLRAAHPGHSLQIALFSLTPMYIVAILIFFRLARVLRKEERAAIGVTVP